MDIEKREETIVSLVGTRMDSIIEEVETLVERLPSKEDRDRCLLPIQVLGNGIVIEMPNPEKESNIIITDATRKEIMDAQKDRPYWKVLGVSRAVQENTPIRCNGYIGLKAGGVALAGFSIPGIMSKGKNGALKPRIFGILELHQISNYISPEIYQKLSEVQDELDKLKETKDETAPSISSLQIKGIK